MVDREIKCPQPIRPLKRKASQLDALETPLCKNSYVDIWLSATHASINRERSRSDSFLVLNMNPERQACQQYGPQDGPQYGPGPARPLSNPNHTRSLQPEPGRYTPAQPPSAFYDPYQTQYTFYTPPTSYPLASQSYQSNVSFPDSKEGSNSSNRVKSPQYRNELENHRVYIDSYSTKTPDAVQTYATNIVGRKRLSPGLSNQEIESTRKELSVLANNDEGSTRTAISRTSLFPTQADYDPKVSIGSDVPFNRAGLPFVSGYNYPPIVIPVPDLHYGYPRSGFDDQEFATMQHSRLKPYSEPNSANF